MDADTARLQSLGYRQELRRSLRLGDSVALGFTTISPVVGLYAIVLVGTTVAGPAWLWVLPVALAGQCLVLCVYAELASEFPLSHGAYQWTRRLVGAGPGWFGGWIALWGYAVANTTIAYLAAPWALTVLGINATPVRVVLAGVLIVAICSLINARGIDLVRRVARAGMAAEVVASLGIGAVLLLAFRSQDIGSLGHTLGAEASSGGSTSAALLASLAVAGWAFIGFDACVASTEETKRPERQVPRAVWLALLSVGALILLNAFAVGLAHPDPAAVVAGNDLDPVTTAVVSSFGAWSTKPFALVVLLAFVACGTTAQGMTARAIHSVARDGTLPGSGFLRRVDRRQVPVGGLAATTVVAAAGLLLGLESTAIGSLISFSTAVIYLTFLSIAGAALVARVRGTWVPSGPVQLGQAGVVLNALAVGWLAFETVNTAWPRASLAPPDAPWYQLWAAVLVLAAILVAGAAYFLATRPDRRIA